MLRIDIQFCCSSSARLQDPTASSSSIFALLNQYEVRIDEERQLFCTNSHPEDWQSTASWAAFREKNQTAEMLEWFLSGCAAC